MDVVIRFTLLSILFVLSLFTFVLVDSVLVRILLLLVAVIVACFFVRELFRYTRNGKRLEVSNNRLIRRRKMINIFIAITALSLLIQIGLWILANTKMLSVDSYEYVWLSVLSLISLLVALFLTKQQINKELSTGDKKARSG